MDFANKLKINEYVSIAQLKRKLKTYLAEQGNSEFKPSIFAQGLVISLVMILEELIADCLKNVSKDKTGLYPINMLVLKNLLYEDDKYSFALKYLRKYSSSIRYHDIVFFNIYKVIDNLETKHGSKLMIESDSKNLIAYLIMSLQYDILNLSIKMVKYSNRKTLNNSVLEIISSYLLSEELGNKIKLKLDSCNIANDDADADDADDDVDDDAVDAVIDAVDAVIDADDAVVADVVDVANADTIVDVAVIDADADADADADETVKVDETGKKDKTNKTNKTNKKDKTNKKELKDIENVENVENVEKVELVFEVKKQEEKKVVKDNDENKEQPIKTKSNKKTK